MFQRYVSSVFSGHMLQVCLSGCVTHTMHMFYLDVAYGCNSFQVLSGVFSSVSTAFRHMLQLLYLDVSKIDRVLHLSSPSAASSRCVLLPTSVGHAYDAAAGPSELEALHPSHSCRSGPAGPTCSARNGVRRAGIRMWASVRTCGR